MEIWQLDPAVYAGRKFTARYRTKGYYDICAAEDGFRLRYVPLGAPMVKSFDDEFFGRIICTTASTPPLSALLAAAGIAECRKIPAVQKSVRIR